ncbi:hypothetical protein Oweho_3209 [Owenweeksia hongkongensis DSM 17368]|uniref:Uncharacterized protein n=1 Tax=Owenweeksia hongkongensis (strain DSM 17368 / CIP 108786 / JCM 12287 / NRRL B-23963 / UST20020801) TaxID=926562 RepID=G8R3S3_OWEHD|nr:hypothetical protein [Owenweeksia hongkongensis]AEV34160.1 hypothetical protein Oweho_3209 [Owenweeksia hongkongensis DSM 17368]
MKKFLKNYGLFSIVMLALVAVGVHDLAITGIQLGAEGVSYAMAGYIAVDVFKTVGGGAPKNKKDMVTFYKLDEIVQSSLERDEKGVLIPQNIQCKPGKYATRFYGTIDKTAPGYTTEGETDARGLIHALAMEHPGDSLELNEWVVNNLNQNIIAVVHECGSDYDKVLGTPCHPLQIVPQGQDDSTAKKTMLNLAGVGRTSLPPGKYSGTHTYSAPLATIADDDTSPSVSEGSGQYQLSENTAATEITTLDDAVHGESYTLLGTGGANASTIPSGNDFQLKDGVTWTAAEGASITFTAFKNAGAGFNFIELSRS